MQKILSLKLLICFILSLTFAACSNKENVQSNSNVQIAPLATQPSKENPKYQSNEKTEKIEKNEEPKNKNSVSTNSEENSSIIEVKEIGKKKEVGNRLLKEFKDYVTKIDSGDNSNYNLIMASDKANGLANFHLDDMTVKWVTDKQSQIKEKLKSSIIFSGYSVSGIHFIALTQSTSKTGDAFKDTTNNIRERKDEFDFLVDILLNTSSRSDKGSYYAIDLFAEDMFGNVKDIKIDNISIPFNNQSDSSIADPNDNRLNDVLLKYSRKLNANKVIQDKQWGVFLFNGGTVATNEIVVDYDGEHVELRK